SSGFRALAFGKNNCLTAPYQRAIYPPFQVRACIRFFGSDSWNECKEAFDEEYCDCVEFYGHRISR
ncbi:hypothetical protein BC938DRAFT_480037, partial [Jimgerdemannia flammicorona]